MKFTLFIAALMTTSVLLSQDCNNFYYFQNNKTIEVSIFNKKGEPGGRQVYKVTDVKNTGASSIATINTEMFDKNEKSIAKAVNQVKCNGGILMMDMKMFMSPEQSQQIKSEAQASDVYLSYPGNMKVGDMLPDGHMNMDIKQNNGMKMSMDVKITDRKVDRQESLTTPAGTWNCFKITYKSNIKIGVMGIGFPVKADVTEWFAPGFGTVKTESKWGKTEITSIK